MLTACTAPFNAAHKQMYMLFSNVEPMTVEMNATIRNSSLPREGLEL